MRGCFYCCFIVVKVNPEVPSLGMHFLGIAGVNYGEKEVFVPVLCKNPSELGILTARGGTVELASERA